MNRPNRQFALLTFAGLGEIAARELNLDSGYQMKHLRNHDLVICSPGEHQTNDLARLRCVEDIFLMLGDPVHVDHTSDLKRLDSHLVQGAILKALHVKNQIFSPDKPKRVTFNCFVKQDHDHRVQRHQIESTVNQAILNAFPRWKIADPASLELWAFYIEEFVYLGFRLTNHAMRYHGEEPALRRGALRPSVAGAMILLAAPAPGDVILDPMCGSGAILRELTPRQEELTLLGGDIDEEGLGKAARSTRGAILSRWDARRLPIADASVNKIVSNLPFGRQYSRKKELLTLYTECIGEWKRVLAQSGRMTLLTSESSILKQVLTSAGLTVASSSKVKVLGIWSTIHDVVQAQGQ